ncbi:MAG TPA: exonuclease domain-containing protein [Microbacteriaceae bacterium]|jgi:DNA polymerase-3 subunit epsilon|nr:exonuclease domain-containing protein [Microbacteriaceae bacterium]
MSNWHDELGVFDLETTGVNVETARIVTAHVGRIGAAGTVIGRFDWIVDPGVEIPQQATAVHGVTTERARADGLPACEAIAEIVAALRGLFEAGIPVVAYNAPYDFTVLNREAVRHRVPPLISPAPIVDPLVIDRAVDKYRRGKRTLEVTAQFYGVDLADAHDAGADAIAAGRVAQAIGRMHAAELAFSPTELHAQQITWSQQQADDFQDYMRRVKDPAFTASGAWPVR